MTNRDLDATERRILHRVAERDGCTPAELALGIEADLGEIYEIVGALREQGLLERRAFDRCLVSEQGREALSDVETADRRDR